MKFTSGRLAAIGSWIKRRFRQGFLGTGQSAFVGFAAFRPLCSLAVAIGNQGWRKANELDEKLRIEFVHFLLQVPLVVV